MDFIAIVSVGFYPTPIPSKAERASFAVTWGLSSLSIMRNLGFGGFTRLKLGLGLK